jgi:hypothetical protein
MMKLFISISKINKGIACAALFSVFMGLSTTSQASVLLQVDLSVTDTITINATDGASLQTITGSDFIGIYFENFFGNQLTTGIDDILLGGDLTVNSGLSGGLPNLFVGSDANERGLNFFSFDIENQVTFTAGEQAFQGSASFTVNSNAYAEALLSNLSGDLFFPADTFDDLDGLSAIGTWEVIGLDVEQVSAPASALLLLAFGLIGVAFSRKKAANVTAQML